MKKSIHSKRFTMIAALGCAVAVMFSLAACSGGGQAAAVGETETAAAVSEAAAVGETDTAAAVSEAPAADTVDYSDYIGYQFSGTDPWGGELAVTIRSIEDGTMAASYTDVIGDYTFYSEMDGMPVNENQVPFGAGGASLEDENTTFSYSGHMEFIGNEQIRFVYEAGEVSTASSEGGSSAYHVEALDESAKTVILSKTVDPTEK